MRKIPIFFTFDNNYVMPATVAFWSLLNKAKPDAFYEMFVLHHDITPENQDKIRKCLNEFTNFELKFMDTKGFMRDEWERGSFGRDNRNTFTSDTLLRCFGASFFPQYDKIIYSDVDVLFADDISELMDIDLGTNYIAAVKDVFMKWDMHELEHLRPDHYEKFKDTYFAGGLWVLNLKQIRQDNLEQKMHEIINDDTIVKAWNDMDVMNIACDNRVVFIPLNYISFPYLLRRMLKPNFASDFSRKELFDSMLYPKIIHYAGIKPWNNHECDLAQLWLVTYYHLHLDKVYPEIYIDYFNTERKRLIAKYNKYKALFNTMLVINVFIVLYSIFTIL